MPCSRALPVESSHSGGMVGFCGWDDPCVRPDRMLGELQDGTSISTCISRLSIPQLYRGAAIREAGRVSEFERALIRDQVMAGIRLHGAALSSLKSQSQPARRPHDGETLFGNTEGTTRWPQYIVAVGSIG